MSFNYIEDKKSLDKFLESIYPSPAYSVDGHWELEDWLKHEVNLNFPYILEFVGTTHLGDGYRVHTKNSIEKLQALINKLKLS